LSETNLPARPERRLTTRPAPDKDSTPIDRNLLSWPIFAPPGTKGFRRLKPKVDIEDGIEVSRSVSVGTYEDTGETLDAFDRLVYFYILDRWISNGCNLADRRVFGSLTTLLKAIKGKRDEVGVRFSDEDISRVKRAIDKLATIPTTWNKAYKQLSGYTTKTITLLERATVFDRVESLKRREGYHGISEYIIHEDVALNIKNENIKLVLLDVVGRIKNPYAQLIYTILESNLPTAKLEIIGGRPHRRYNKKVMDLAADLEMKTDYPQNVRKIIRRACEELVGAFLTDGMISACGIEKSKATGEWIFFATYALRPKKIVDVSAKVTPAALAGSTAAAAPAAGEKDDLAEARRFYDLLPPADRARIDEIKARVFAERYKRFPAMENYAFLDAVEEYAKHRVLGMMTAAPAATPFLVARERCLTPYMSAAERLAKEEEERKKADENQRENQP
jgi:hypothetical protein